MVYIYYRVTECTQLMNPFTFAFQAFHNIALFTMKLLNNTLNTELTVTKTFTDTQRFLDHCFMKMKVITTSMLIFFEHWICFIYKGLGSGQKYLVWEWKTKVFTLQELSDFLINLFCQNESEKLYWYTFLKALCLAQALRSAKDKQSFRRF